MRQVDAYSIFKRQSILSEYCTYTAQEAARCSLLFENARKNNKKSDIVELIEECSENKANGKIYGRILAEMVSDDESLTKQFLSTISMYESGTLNDILTSKRINDTIRNSIIEQIEFNEACDTVYNNHKSITEEYDIPYFITLMHTPDINIITDKICEMVDRFNIPVYGKVQSAISEAYYLFSKFGLDFKEKELIDYVAEYFLLSNGPYKDNLQIRAISESLENTYLKYVISEGLFDKPDEYLSSVESICKDFSEAGDTSPGALDHFHNSIMDFPIEEVAEDFNKYLNTLMRILMMPEEDQASDHIIRSIIIKIYVDTKANNRDILKTLLTRLDWHITKVDNYINNYKPEAKVYNRLEKYRDSLKDTRELLDADIDTIYTSYNESCIEFSKDAKPISINEFKIFKFDNLISRTYKLDRYIQNKVEPSRQKIFKYVKDKNQEIFGESDASIYDFITPEGNIDYCVRSYAYDESSVDFNELNSYLTKIIIEANESILNDSDLLCYYELTSDLVEFHIKSPEILSLDEDDKTIIENYLSREDEDRMLTIFTAGSLINEDFDYNRDSVNYFSSHKIKPDDIVGAYRSFLEASAAIGISKDIIKENYNNILSNLEGYRRNVFRYYGSDLVDRYIPESNNNLMDILEAYNYTQYLLELVNEPYTAVNTKNLQKYGYNGEEERKRGSDYDDEDDNRPQKQQPKQNPTPHKADPPEEADDDYQDVQKQGPMANMTPTNIKLAGKAAGQRIKNADAKIDRAFRMSDVIFNHFIKSCKQALISDRREAIIKGSVIPSFSKCIKIGIVLAGLGVATGGLAVPVLTAIGGLIASKKLTKRERSLLLDDIEVEIQVIDKELQIADANNQINKYRALMKMKKDLQRQYQRIKVGIRVGKDIIPSKTAIDSEI